MATYRRSDQVEIHVQSSALTLDLESWDMMEGGDPVAEEVNVFPGGMKPQIALGGLAKWTPLTIERAWSESLANVYKELANRAGSLPIEASYIQLGSNQVPTGYTLTYTGVLTSAERPKYKATESTEAFVKITIAVNGSVH